MNAGNASTLLRTLGANWALHQPSLALDMAGDVVTNIQRHPLESEVAALCSGAEASLPFFAGTDSVRWCTLAPTMEWLRRSVVDLNAWVLPSFGWQGPGDGFISPEAAQGGLAQEILRVSPDGYFRWQCSKAHFEQVRNKLAQRRRLEAQRPVRSRRIRPSLYELRSNFSTALLLGDRSGASQAIEAIDLYQLDSAANTQFMRIRMWHHFRDFARIINHPDLARLRSQLLPGSVGQWIEDARQSVEQRGQPDSTPSTPSVSAPSTTRPETWDEWFKRITADDEECAQDFLRERTRKPPEALSTTEVAKLVDRLEELYVDEGLLKRRREILSQGLAEFLQDFVREPEFPRANFGDLYVAVLRLWGVLHAGTGSRGHESHVLLELASAALQLNRAPSEVLSVIVQWWNARKVPAQLPFLLDAVELLAREHPDQQAPSNLWIEAADFVRRDPSRLTQSEKALWRRIGSAIGMDRSTILEYLPDEEIAESQDILRSVQLEKVAIVCTRERQGADAAATIKDRSGATTFVVASKQAGAGTTRALKADVVLFVWMATTHSVFRAFDGFDREKFCYVQGTGSGSIVLALERWAMEQVRGE